MGVDIFEDITYETIKGVLTKYTKHEEKDIIETKAKKIMEYLENNRDKVNKFVKNYRNKQQGGKKKKTRKKKSLRKKRKKRRGIKTRSRKGGKPEIFVLFVICSFAFYWMDLVPGNNAHQTVYDYESDTDESYVQPTALPEEDDVKTEEKTTAPPQPPTSVYNGDGSAGESKHQRGQRRAQVWDEV